MPGPGLAVGRALGDLEASKLGLLSKPAVSPSFHFGPGSSLVVASDGVWDMITREEAAVLLLEAESPQSAAYDLVADARKNWLVHGDIDDITALVVVPVYCELMILHGQSRPFEAKSSFGNSPCPENHV